MVLGQGAIGLLLLTAILVSVWQLNTYNDARRVWMETQERLSLISNVEQGNTELVLVTHRVAFTQDPFPPASEIIRRPTDSIVVSAGRLELRRDQLEQEASSLPVDNPIRARLIRAVGLIDELIRTAVQTVDLGLAEDWTAAQELVSRASETSLVPQFDRVYTDLDEELQQATILTQEDTVNAQKQMDNAGNTAMGVTVSAAVTVIALGILLSLNTIRSITDPIDELSSAATLLAGGAFDVRVPATRHDEFEHLATVFNDMAAKLGEIYAGKDRQIHDLLIKIDEAKVNEGVDRITGADLFKRLRARATYIRASMNSKR